MLWSSSFFFQPTRHGNFSVTCPSRPPLTGLTPSSQMTSHVGGWLIIWAKPHRGFGLFSSVFFIYEDRVTCIKKTKKTSQNSRSLSLYERPSFQPEDILSNQNIAAGSTRAEAISHVTTTPRDNGSQSSVGRDGTLRD